MGKNKFLKRNVGFLFILPWLIGFLVFKLYPFAASLYYSFTDYQLFEGITKYTMENYVDIFTTPKIVKALKVTFQYSFMTVPLKLVAALFIAYILNFKIKGVNFFRTAYYIPSILGGSVAIAVLWKAIFKDDGLLNTLLGFFGVNGPSWLSDPSYALFVICLLRVWQFGSAMVIFLAALKGVPEELYEAASIEGAGKWKQFFSITVPLITPIIFYNLVTQICQAFQEFNGPYIITQGGPRNSTTLISLLIYNSAFKNYEMGMASAMAWVLFIILMVFTVIAFLSQKYWVYYSDEEGR
ncbi:MAG: sugar ABC transporter permease [Lachnospiraceae bacterium]|jgi:oligogalacturonide transport system permease protein|nr:sugar ABC transporter permease [Lachnospiraceae bacterium]MDE7276661.1 sugar ABC transporter permease [Lachnospiraceae bacterium]MDE7341455.1 sugar ABC transporter permease [Lachnospiraceae bacterium]